MDKLVALPNALALDFDGVLCNGLKEYFQVSIKAYCQLWPEANRNQALEWEPLFGRLRPVVETGWEMPLVLKAIETGYEEDQILLNWPQIRTQLLQRFQLDAKQLGKRVDSLRDTWITEDLMSWLSLHSFYPGILGQLQQWLDSKFSIFIITTKESRFVDALLRQHGIQLSKSMIFGKDRQQPKADTLLQLQSSGWTDLWFVEDRLNTLTTIAPMPVLQSVKLFLADWGYNTDRERHEAMSHESIRLLTLEQFAQSFDQWAG